jgi:pimeloyl-ACP methyl ester carboxylesterase
MSTLFPGTYEYRQKIEGVEIFARIGGSGPPLLLVHGFPQTHAMWHKSKARLHYATPEHIHATCNDDGAGATYDLKADEDDRAAGRKITCPTLALWGHAGIQGNFEDPLRLWREWCDHAEGQGIDSGHFVAEENPQATLAGLLPFLMAHAH